MAAASANGSIVRCTHFHPQHTLRACHYSEASTHPCAACELAVTGDGYRCDGCGFNIHGECMRVFDAAGCISFSLHPAHALTLTYVAAGRCCDFCRRTSPAGGYMYLCEPCGYAVHPMCVVEVDVSQEYQRRRGRGRRAMRAVGQVAHTAHTIHRLVDLAITVAQFAACTIM